MKMVQYIDPRELNDLARFAARGGLGSGVAYVYGRCDLDLLTHLIQIDGLRCRGSGPAHVHRRR